MRQYIINELEELIQCVDKCCLVFPTITENPKIIIACKYCGREFQSNDTSDKRYLHAMISWNKQVRRDTKLKEKQKKYR